jgi:predicted DCC family thiol-disulfide oxidoreductase YuxK
MEADGRMLIAVPALRSCGNVRHVTPRRFYAMVDTVTQRARPNNPVEQPQSEQPQPAPDWEVEVFFDGDCPLCKREIKMLQMLDRRRRIRFTDIADPEFDAEQVGVSWDDLMGEIHGRLPDGTWVRGVEVFRRLYGAIGWKPLVWLSRLPILSPLLDRAYRLFARNRLKWTGRCSADGSQCRNDGFDG